MNKHIIPLFALLVGVAAFSSCEDQLDIPQKGVTSESEFYKTDADCAKALASVATMATMSLAVPSTSSAT